MWYVIQSSSGVYYMVSNDLGCVDYVYKSESKSLASQKCSDLNRQMKERRREIRKALRDKTL